MLSSTPWIEHIATIAVSGGFVCSLALVCMLQYLVGVWNRSRHRRERDQLKHQMAGLASELAHLECDREFIQLENEILREFVSEVDLDLGLRRFLQRFIPAGSRGFAAFVIDDGRQLRQSCQLSEQTSRDLAIDAFLMERLRRESHIVLTPEELQPTELFASLSEESRQIVGPLHLIRTPSQPGADEAVLVATSLIPRTADPQRQVQLVERLLEGVGKHVRRIEDQRVQEQELRVAREILELRSIVDLEFRSPTEMMEDFLARLAAVTGFDQAAVYLVARNEVGARLFARCRDNGGPLDLEASLVPEGCLAAAGLQRLELLRHGPRELAALCSDSGPPPFAEAITHPLQHDRRTVGVICLTRLKAGHVGAGELELVQWAAGYLLESMLRTADRALVEQQARLDALTGLANRRSFDTVLEEYVSQACSDGQECALVLLDMDHFKLLNDEYGHLAGDAALRAVGKLIHEESSRQMRGADRPLAARYGGEELALILPGVGRGAACRVAEAIRSRVAATPVSFNGVEIPVSLSAGVASAPEQGQTVLDLIAAADAALYRAKANGRDRVEEAFTPLPPRERGPSIATTLSAHA